MSVYAVGDVQGCYDQLMRVLDRAAFDPNRDELWFVGDLVNRGPRSSDVIRFAMHLGERAVAVLGNHDLTLLAVAEGIRKPHADDTFSDVLDAPDRDGLIEWLRRQKLMHAAAGYAMVHAGLLPQWSIGQALALAREVEAALAAPDYRDFLSNMYGNEPVRWHDGLAGIHRLRIVVNAMTRMRLVSADGTLEYSHKAGIDNLPKDYMPWYDVPDRASRGTTVVFGHWASLGLLVRPDVVGLDSGCVWGRQLSVLRLSDRKIIQCDCSEMTGTASGD